MPTVIDPRGIHSSRDLTEHLAALFNRGAWSIHRLAEVAELSEGAVHSILTGKTRVPQAKTLAAFVSACGEDPAPWLDARTRVAANSHEPHTRDIFRQLIESHTDLFAGRDAQTAEVLRFVKEQRTGYVFIEGLSGYGKTSFLADLVKRNPKFCYHFISQAHKQVDSTFDPTSRSDLMLNVWEQLNPGRSWAGDARRLELEFQQLLFERRRDPIVIVLDAVDELESVIALRGYLPTTLPENVTVILSARTQGDHSPLQELGLSPAQMGMHLTMPALDAAAITELLRQAGKAALPFAGDADFTAILLEVSRGDPFYLRFLVEDVAAGLLTRENADQTPTGLAAYLDLQLELLDRSAHRSQHKDIFGMLLEAGTLSRRGLMESVDGLTWSNFDTILREIHRFILVYGDKYTFCHDRFRTYFQGKRG